MLIFSPTSTIGANAAFHISFASCTVSRRGVQCLLFTPRKSAEHARYDRLLAAERLRTDSAIGPKKEKKKNLLQGARPGDLATLLAGLNSVPGSSALLERFVVV